MTTRPALHFVQLNRGWNAEPNAPDVTITTAVDSVTVEFDEVSGDIDELPDPGDWKVLGDASKVGRHFLFYFRDDTFECVASEWRLVRGSHVEG